MKRDLLILRAMQALMVIQVLVGVLSIFTVDIGRAIAVFGSAALIYLGITIIQQLVSIREVLSYSALQQPLKKEPVQTTGILHQLRKERFTKKDAPSSGKVKHEEPVVNSPTVQEDENRLTENRVYTVRTAAAQGEDLS
jgi:hypothetical protein